MTSPKVAGLGLICRRPQGAFRTPPASCGLPPVPSEVIGWLDTALYSVLSRTRRITGHWLVGVADLVSARGPHDANVIVRMPGDRSVFPVRAALEVTADGRRRHVANVSRPDGSAYPL
jgi:hypothetical protein